MEPVISGLDKPYQLHCTFPIIKYFWDIQVEKDTFTKDTTSIEQLAHPYALYSFQDSPKVFYFVLKLLPTISLQYFMDTAKCLRYNFEKNNHIVQLNIIFYNLRDQNSNDKYINTLKYI